MDVRFFYVNFSRKESRRGRKLLKPKAISFSHQNITDKVLIALQNKIIRGGLKPNQRIYVAELSKEFNISQTPIREALYKLEGMNLVDIKPQKGIYVANFSKQDVLDILDVRMALENLAIQRISDISEDLIEKMKDNLRLFRETIKIEDFVVNNKIDKAFHTLIIGASGSKQLIRIYKDIHSHISVERFLYKGNRKALSELHTTDKEHCRIFQAFMKKDKKEIRKAISTHFKNIKRRITKI